ncbi:MAG: hypothetical protein JO360_03250 [Acidobacteria bacterium]|nr:hypothetical protein [Acidobacteriota bacterium]
MMQRTGLASQRQEVFLRERESDRRAFPQLPYFERLRQLKLSGRRVFDAGVGGGVESRRLKIGGDSITDLARDAEQSFLW